LRTEGELTEMAGNPLARESLLFNDLSLLTPPHAHKRPIKVHDA
jgi:hypothetical protein